MYAFISIEDLAVDGKGNFYVSDSANSCVWRLDRCGHIARLLISQVNVQDEQRVDRSQPPTGSNASGAYRIVLDAEGNLYVADSRNHRVLRIDKSGVTTTVAGCGQYGYSRDGLMAVTAKLAGPSGIAIDCHGNLYIAECDNSLVRKVDKAGIMTTVAGTGGTGYRGDGGKAVLAKLNNPGHVAVDVDDNLYIADDGNRRIRKVDKSGIITTVRNEFSNPSSLVVDDAHNLYTADAIAISKIDASGAFRVLENNRMAGEARQLAVDSGGNLYIADNWRRRIRKVDKFGIVTTVVAAKGRFSR